MNVQQRGIITLVKSALSGEVYSVPDGFSLSEAMQTIINHNISALIYYGALNCGYDKSNEVMQVLFEKACFQVAIDEQQRAEFTRVFDAFENANIDYMPLKGLTLKKIYPNSVMRAMGDADILVRSTQIERAEKMLRDLGYQYVNKDDHETVWVNNIFVIDLHKSLMSFKNKEFHTHFGDGWNVAEVCCDTHKHKMSSEDFYIFVFAHFAKHYATAGAGMKHIIDLHVLRTSTVLNFEYIDEKLKKMKLYTFHSNIVKTLNVWFDSLESDEITDFITKAIFESAEYGLKEKSEVGGLVRDAKHTGSVSKIKTKKFIKVILLPYEEMCKRYNILRKAPFLLPIMWCVRFCDVLFNKRRKLKGFVEHQKRISNKNIEAFKNELRFVGLDCEE